MTWIIGKRADPLWLMGGTLIGYALVLAFGHWRFDFALVWFAWMAGLNGPHVFAMYTRTYLSAEERAARGALLWRSLALFLIGPAVLVLGYLLGRSGVTWSDAPVLGYFVVAVLWAYWHTVRQHHGIVRLYQRRNGDLAPWDRVIDRLVVHVGLVAALVILMARSPAVHANLRLARPGAVAVADALRIGAIALLVLLAALFVGRQVQRLVRRQPINIPKVLFLAAVIPYYVFICASDTVAAAPLFAVVPLFVIPHDLQYHALVWFYHRDRRPERRPGARWPLAVVGHLVGAAVLGALLAAGSCFLDRELGCPAIFYETSPYRLSGIGARELLFVLFNGVFIHHYFLDQHIWKPSRDERLAAQLGIV